MMEIKGVNELNKILNEFLEPFEVTCELGSDFMYSAAKDLIRYSLVDGGNNGKYFMDNFHQLAPDITCDIFLASFLHELGHHVENDALDDTEEELCEQQRKEIQLKAIFADEEEEIKALNYEYFNLPDEYLATQWAINYIRNNVEKIRQLWDEIQRAIMYIYAINKVEVF